MKGKAKNQAFVLVAVLIVVVIIAVVAAAFILYDVNVKATQDKEYIGHAGELKVLSQQIAKNATEAASGTEEAFLLLNQARNNFQTRMDILENGEAHLPPIADQGSDTVNTQMTSLKTTWEKVKSNADSILQTEDTVLSLHDVAATLSETIPQLQIEYDEVVEILLDNNAPADQVAVAQRQSWLAERIVGSVNKVLEGTEESVMAADSFGRDASLFGRVLNGMINGDESLNITKVADDEAVDRLNEISDLFEFVSGSVDEILETSPELFQVREASDQIFTDTQQLLKDTTGLADSIENLAQERPLKTYFGLIFGLVGLIAVIGIGFVLVVDSRNRLRETAEANEANQNAILRLLDELADLADGDLTVSATVTEDFTGAIADSINFSIDQLRQLVTTINETAVQVSSAAQETQATAMHLAEASEHQAQEIAGASAAVNQMAVSIDQVSANAAESAAVAERSVGIANKGNEVVQNTIAGMDTIREQIQDTSKRIKRLGESSQEIGDIVSLINDIADQTNILALNAAIQASMAGDAGRGFAVVADEVQRLAERSSAATKQIEALVKTIQTDTNEAVISMEQTTAEVVKGARLAQDAGVSLEEIEKVSKHLADLIQNISNAARQQASSAGHISNTMNVIQEITSQTSAGTNATANSIGNLAELATEMRKSVAGFKLPESEALN
ncbi:methyl-accepting chemotaxis protein [Spartinivicinus poritis]|uniref:Methyl-accepting chemotaxis protein n=1 Tax=Spartinivicinus poritis TaxID=2994640 RepID=A0ABT5UCT3_9GAMM|nr:methyl-accepting chemotaxis protein [Spartinivicinus sp. A2-2]